MKKILLILAASLILFSCEKENVSPVISDTKTIVSPDQAKADSLGVSLQEYLTVKAAMASLIKDFTSQNSHTTNNATNSTSGF